LKIGALVKLRGERTYEVEDWRESEREREREREEEEPLRLCSPFHE
jgi:hypothetical protein